MQTEYCTSFCHVLLARMQVPVEQCDPYYIMLDSALQCTNDTPVFLSLCANWIYWKLNHASLIPYLGFIWVTLIRLYVSYHSRCLPSFSAYYKETRTTRWLYPQNMVFNLSENAWLSVFSLWLVLLFLDMDLASAL